MLIFLIYTTLFLLYIASLLLFRLVYHRILSFSFLSRPSLAISVFIEHCNYLYSYFFTAAGISRSYKSTTSTVGIYAYIISRIRAIIKKVLTIIYSLSSIF